MPANRRAFFMQRTTYSRNLFGLVVLVCFVVPGVELAQLGADALELMLGSFFAGSEEVCASAGFVLGDPLGSKGAVLNLGKNFLHLSLGLIGDESLAGLVVAKLSGVGDRITHLGEAAV